MAKNRNYRSRMVPVVWATALLYAPLAQALGLGPLAVTSNLGQPLRAEIPLLSLRPGERHSVHVGMASGADFAAAGLRKSRSLRAIHCHIRRVGGRYEVILRSREPIDEPFLHFLLRVKWSDGSLLRMYTALLNPTSGVTVVSAGGSALPQGESAAQIRPIATALPAPRPAPSPYHATTNQGTTVIRPGETLWGVALRTAPHTGTMPQALQAFLRINPAAFFNKNINDLRSGVVLKIPTAQEIRAQNAPRAAVWLASQDKAWNRYKTELAQMPATTTGASTQVGGTLARARLLPANQRPLHIEATRLTTAAAAGGGGQAAGSQSINQRMQRLKKALRKTRRLMTLENQELALLERQAAARTRIAPAAVAGAFAKKTTTRIVAHPAPVIAPVVAHPIRPARPMMAPVRPLPPPPPAPSFLSTLLSSERTPILGALLVIILGGGFLVIRRRRQTMAEFEESILSGGGLTSEGQMPDTAGLAKTPDVSFLSEFSQGNAAGALHTDEVDPLAEADVYLAYGRDEQAEEILREAATKEPSRLELKLKLLEIYLQRNDKKTFEIVAEEIYAASEGRGPVWQRVEEMGRKFDPTNPLFKGNARASQPNAGGGARDDAAPSAGGLGDRIDFAAVARELAEVSAPRSDAPGFGGRDGSLDWSLGDASGSAPLGGPGRNEPTINGAEANAPGTGDDSVLDFSLDLGHPSELEGNGDKHIPNTSSATDMQAQSVDFQWDQSAQTPPKAEEDADEFAIRFDDAETQDLTAGDLDLGGVATKPASREARPASHQPFELAGEGEGDVAVVAEKAIGGEAVDTKLDLAQAYIDMGDKDGARGILEEVQAEGDGRQRAQAKQLLGKIA